VAGAYPKEIVDQAEALYVRDGLGIKDIAARPGFPPASTLRRWSEKHGWNRRRRRHMRGEEELDQLLARIKLALARMILPDRQIDENIDPKLVNTVCRAVAVLSPPASVLLKRLDQEEAENRGASVEERMNRVMALLKGSGFLPEEDADES
jgi:hypothetical protein